MWHRCPALSLRHCLPPLTHSSPCRPPLRAVDDYELLSDCKASATLCLRADQAQPASWDTLVLEFVSRL